MTHKVNDLRTIVRGRVLLPGDDRLRRGEATLDELPASQNLYDNHFLDSPAWTRDRQAS